MLGQLGHRKRVESEVFDKPGRGRDALGAARDLGERLGEPRLDFRADRRALLGVGFEHPLEGLDDFEAFDLARAGAREFGVGEAQDADAFVRTQAGAGFFEMRAQVVFHRAAAFTARVGRHHQRRGLLALGNLQADDRKFLDKRGVAVNFLEFVDINIVAAGVDDHVLGAADDIEPSVFVEAAEVSRAEPSVVQHLVGGGLVVVVTRHHVRTARQDFAHCAVAAGGELDFDSVAAACRPIPPPAVRPGARRSAPARPRSVRNPRAAVSRCR